MNTDLPHSPVISDAMAVLNRLGIIVDAAGCFYEDGRRICLSTERGMLLATDNGVPVAWREIVPTLKARAPIPGRPPSLDHENWSLRG